MTGKREPPLWLNMSFAEALERFADASPGEVTASVERGKTEKPPETKRPRRKAPKAVSESGDRNR